MIIQDGIYTLRKKLNESRDRLDRLSEETNRIENEKAAAIAEVKKRWQEKARKIHEDEAQVLVFAKIAKENTRKELVRGGGSFTAPDFGKLNELVYAIKSESDEDWRARQIIELCGEYLTFLDKSAEALKVGEQAECDRIAAEFAGSLRRVEDGKELVREEFRRFIRESDIREQAELLRRINAENEINEEYFRSAISDDESRSVICAGFEKRRLEVPPELRWSVKELLGSSYDDKNGMMEVPTEFSVKQGLRLSAEYIPENRQAAFEGIQALILHLLRYRKSEKVRVSLLDSVYYNANILGDLRAFCEPPNSPAEVAQSEEDISAALTALVREYREIETRIGSQSVYEYNKTAAKKIPLRMIILHRPSENRNMARFTTEEQLGYLMNNAGRLGLMFVELWKNHAGGIREEENIPKTDSERILIVSDSSGRFLFRRDNEWMPFRWIRRSCPVPAEFIAKCREEAGEKKVGTDFFARYGMRVPKKPEGVRREIRIPFAVDEKDEPVYYSFERNMFALYISGAAGSGKSTVLHTLISGLISEYHPDEVELWMADFKMVEFRDYVDDTPPHVKYLLLEESEELVYDFLDKLEQELKRRERLFAIRGWKKMADVPSEDRLPAVFIVIDEFAYMAQVIQETGGSGIGRDYKKKLEELLAKGRALGLRFILSDQIFANRGLTDKAEKQIQGRLVLKNDPEDMKTALRPYPDGYTDRVRDWISEMPIYQCLYKQQDEEGRVKIDKYRNMYVNSGDKSEQIRCLKENIPDRKRPVLLDGSGRPESFTELEPLYLDLEKKLREEALPPGHALYGEELFDGDILMYPGVPASFDKAKPFILKRDDRQNILLAGNQRKEMACVIKSVIACCSRGENPCEAEIWSHDRCALAVKFGELYNPVIPLTEPTKIRRRIMCLKEQIEKGKREDRLIIIADGAKLFDKLEKAETGMDESTLSELEARIIDIKRQLRAETNPEKKRGLMEAHNKAAEEYRQAKAGTVVGDAVNDLKLLTQKGPEYGVRFMVCAESENEYDRMRLRENDFVHRLAFTLPTEWSSRMLGNRKAADLKEGNMLYINREQPGSVIMKPHVHPGVILDGWTAKPDGVVCPVEVMTDDG